MPCLTVKSLAVLPGLNKDERLSCPVTTRLTHWLFRTLIGHDVYWFHAEPRKRFSNLGT